MQIYSSSTVPIVDIVLAVVVLAIAFLLIFKIIRLFSERPDITALLSIVAMFIGYGLLITTESSSHGLTVFVCGVVGLFISAMNYSRSKGVKS